MFGILAVAVSSLLEEFSDSVGRDKAKKREAGVYSLAFLHLFWAAIIFLLLAVIRHSFSFSAAALPTFILRSILEIVQAQISVVALIKADRSTFSFIRIGTIPLLFLVDQALGYSISPWQMIGVVIILISLGVLLFKGDLDRRGLVPVIGSTVLAVVTLSLYKYNITKFHSVETEQGLISVVLLVYFLVGSIVREHRNPFSFLRHKIFLAQSLGIGLGSVFLSFAYQYSAPSVITTARRSFSALWSTLSGHYYFHERRLTTKIVALLLMVVGLIFLAK